MDRFREMEVFATVAETGGFAAAGRRLNLSAPSITRIVAALEDRLGARLLNRTTRSLALTEIGERYVLDARSLLADLDQLERSAIGEQAEPRGHITVSASVTFGRDPLAPMLCAFLQAFPKVRVSALFFDRVVNLTDEGIDVAVCIDGLPDSSLVARRFGTVQRVLVASPGYLARHGRPDHPDDLASHNVIAFTGLMPNREWRHHTNGKPAHVTLNPRLEINDASASIDAAAQGDGITIALSYMVARQIRDGLLEPVLTPFTPPPAPVHLVYPQSRLVAPNVRAFMDFMAPRLTAALDDLNTPPPARG